MNVRQVGRPAINRVEIVDNRDLLTAQEQLNEQWLERSLHGACTGANTFQCLQWVACRRLVANNRDCGNCNVAMLLEGDRTRQDGYFWRCTHCRSKKSVRADCWFAGSRLPLQDIILIIYKWCFNVPLKSIMREIGIETGIQCVTGAIIVVKYAVAILLLLVG